MLSKHIHAQPGPIDHVLQEYFILPLEKLPVNLEQRRFEEYELDWMRRFPAARLMNRTRLITNRRRRHCPPSFGAPSNQPPPHLRRFRASTAAHVMQLTRHVRTAEFRRWRVETLRSTKHALPPGHAIRGEIDSIISARQAALPQRKATILVPFRSFKQERVRIHEILSECTAALWPAGPQQWGVTSRNNTTLGSCIYNYTSHAIGKTDHPTCPCQELQRVLGADANQFIQASTGGHIMTGDPSVLSAFVTSEQLYLLKELCSQGAKFRLSTHPRVAIAEFHNIVSNFHYNTVNPPMEWRVAVMEKFSAQLSNNNEPRRFPHVNLAELRAAIHRHFVVTPADKNPQKMVFWCQQLYKDKLLEQLGSEVFEPVADLDGALDNVKEGLKKIEKWDNHYMIFPYNYVIPKLHRLDEHRAPLRLVCGKTGKNVVRATDPIEKKPLTWMTEFAPTLAAALNSVIDLLVLNERDEPIRRCWIMRDSQELIDMYATLPREVQEIRTTDFKTMYTQLDHGLLRTALETVLKQDVAKILADKFNVSLLDACAKIVFRNDPRGYAWELKARTYDADWTINYIFTVCEVIIERLYSFSQLTFMRQKVGLPMGVEPAPPMANLCFYYFESRFVDGLVAQKGAPFVMNTYHGFLFNGRYIDDCIGPRYDATGTMTPAQYGGCQYAITNAIDQAGNYIYNRALFLGIQCSVTPTGVEFKAHDKQQAFDFIIVRFPSWHTNLGKPHRVGTIVGMLVRTFRLSTKMDDALRETKLLIGLFKKRGYLKDDVRTGLAKFLKRNVWGKYHQRFHREWDPLLVDWPQPRPIRRPPQPTTVATAAQTNEVQPQPQQQQAHFRAPTSEMGTQSLDSVREIVDIQLTPVQMMVQSTPQQETIEDPLSTPGGSSQLATVPLILASPLPEVISVYSSQDESLTGGSLQVYEPPPLELGPPLAGPPAAAPAPNVVIHHHHHGDNYNNYGSVQNTQINGPVNNGTVNNSQYNQYNHGDVNFGSVENTLHGGLMMGGNYQQINDHSQNSLAISNTPTINNSLTLISQDHGPPAAGGVGDDRRLLPRSQHRQRLLTLEPPITRGRIAAARQQLQIQDRADSMSALGQHSQPSQLQGSALTEVSDTSINPHRSKRVRDEQQPPNMSSTTDDVIDSDVAEEEDADASPGRFSGS
jgi:hypothetical protein